ncbi:hypothetical protein PFDG_02533 [Plasmodium falciparum Dd2]|uniref:Uncharacterized protein n=1 Tax=Plasmodium falciparum (isolate Dd2) TaxID=57267 RepID=A0A0L7M1H1_PLAF4|nr:hypothetical protein PFDG_02533 [Plasmodium falciparum Dd2]
MEYLNKIYMTALGKKRDVTIDDDVDVDVDEDVSNENIVNRIKQKNCCKKWSTSMYNKNILINYRNDVDKDSFFIIFEKAWKLFFHDDTKGKKLLLHEENDNNIYSLPNFLIIDNLSNYNPIGTENIRSMNNDQCDNEDNIIINDDNTKYILEDMDAKKIASNKTFPLNKKFIDIYHKHDDTYCSYDKEIDDFLILPDIIITNNETINVYREINDDDQFLNVNNNHVKNEEHENNVDIIYDKNGTYNINGTYDENGTYNINGTYDENGTYNINGTYDENETYGQNATNIDNIIQNVHITDNINNQNVTTNSSNIYILNDSIIQILFI